MNNQISSMQHLEQLVFEYQYFAVNENELKYWNIVASKVEVTMAHLLL